MVVSSGETLLDTRSHDAVIRVEEYAFHKWVLTKKLAQTEIGVFRDYLAPTKTLATEIAAGIDRELEAGPWAHYAVYERDLVRLWPLEQIDREKRIAEFAKEYGFSLRFYMKGLCAIFAKDPETG